MHLQRLTILLAFAGLLACKGDDIVPAIDDGNNPPPPDASPDADPGNLLFLRLSFDETSGTTANDSSGRGMHATLSDAAARTPDGRIGGGVALTGGNPANRFVELPNGVLTGVDDFTISVWVKLNSIGPWARIYDIGNGLADPANRFMYLTVNGFTGPDPHGLHAASYGGSPTNESTLITNTQLPTGVWKHVTLTGSGGKRQLLIDGFPAATVAAGPSVPPLEMEPIAPQSWLGRSRFPDAGLDGVIDEFQIFNYVLSQPEIAELAAPQRDYAYWRFDEGAGATARDASDFAIPTAVSPQVGRTTGRLGGAVDFTGGPNGATGPVVTLGANPLAGCTTQLTVAAWIKLRSLTPWSRVFDFGTAFTHFIFLAPTDGAGMHFAMVSPAGIFDMITATPPIAADNAWHHVAVTVGEAGLVTIYADGAVIKTQTSAAVKPGDFAGVTENFIGKSRFPDDRFLDGAIDELRISCRAFTADEIKNLAQPSQP